MEYYEFHYIVADLVEMIKAENDANKSQSEKTGEMMGGMKMPNMKIPNMKMPKL